MNPKPFSFSDIALLSQSVQAPLFYYPLNQIGEDGNYADVVQFAGDTARLNITGVTSESGGFTGTVAHVHVGDQAFADVTTGSNNDGACMMYVNFPSLPNSVNIIFDWGTPSSLWQLQLIKIDSSSASLRLLDGPNVNEIPFLMTTNTDYIIGLSFFENFDTNFTDVKLYVDGYLVLFDPTDVNYVPNEAMYFGGEAEGVASLELYLQNVAFYDLPINEQQAKIITHILRTGRYLTSIIE